MDETKIAEVYPKPEWLASYGGFRIVLDPSLAPGWVQFRDDLGNIIGMISDVGEIRIARNKL
jgi:hypothetical protein